FQLYSSGTTGHPKGVMLSNDNFFGLLPLAKENWELHPEAVNLAAMPLFHIGGGGWAVAGMYEGATTVIVRDLDPAALITLIGTSTGFSVSGGAEGVGRATTRAVVLSISAIVVADMLFSFFLNR
ncbi:MAG TPA: AMP-binding protein, partial [Ilumatobacteraceae bacterium]|nr:AMP-binding protein [Ilumatobacteraceae bacterium]